MGAAGDMRQKLVLGFKLGAIIGGTFGGVIGAYYSFVYRSIFYLPVFAFSSGLSFGFFMAIGTLVRGGEGAGLPADESPFVVVRRLPNGELSVSRTARYSEE